MPGSQIILRLLWGALGLYWLYNARKTKKTAVDENSGLRVFRLSVLFLTIALIMTNWLRIGPLARRFVVGSPIVVWFGVGLTGIGIGLAVSARWKLGQNWSDKVVLKVDHELIRTGPYAYLRHPIYTGIFLAVVGSAIAVGECRGLLAVVLLGANYCLKALREEKILAANFGNRFTQYKQRTGFFLPGL